MDVFEKVARDVPGARALRQRNEHAQILDAAEIPRFRALDVIASMQPTHATSDMRWADERLGPERIAGAYAWRRLAPDHSKLAFGSDFPVEDSNPLLGVYAAITRQDATAWPDGGFLPDQRLDAADAIAAFTLGAARAVREEGVRGRLTVGHAADLTVLDVDPLHCDPRALLTARVRMTVVDGEVVYSEPSR
jgi:predicted amidohydrolase YtcJ